MSGTAFRIVRHPLDSHPGTCTMCEFPPKPDLEALGQELYEASLQFSGCEKKRHCDACWFRLRTAWMHWANRETLA